MEFESGETFALVQPLELMILNWPGFVQIVLDFPVQCLPLVVHYHDETTKKTLLKCDLCEKFTVRSIAAWRFTSITIGQVLDVPGNVTNVPVPFSLLS